MVHLDVAELILDRKQYAAQRAERRGALIPVRRRRRLRLGERLLLEFENEQTLTYQVQEMVYVENISDESAAMEEVDAYRRLLPTNKSVAATLFLEFTDTETVRQELARLDGVHRMIELTLGSHTTTAEDVPPPDEGDAEHTYSVHFLRFTFDDEMRGKLPDLRTPATLSVAHPRYSATAELPPELRAELARDLGLL